MVSNPESATLSGARNNTASCSSKSKRFDNLFFIQLLWTASDSARWLALEFYCFHIKNSIFIAFKGPRGAPDRSLGKRYQMMRKIIFAKQEYFLFNCHSATANNKRGGFSIVKHTEKKNKNGKSGAVELPSSPTHQNPKPLFYDGQWFIMRFKMCLLPFRPRQKGETSGAHKRGSTAISPIFQTILFIVLLMA